jgi:hypothetical protein
MKKATIPKLARELFNAPAIGNLDKHLLVSEVLWDHDGRKVIFPGNEDFFKTLLRSNFTLGDEATLHLPYSSFLLAMPKGFEVDGIRIPSVVVNYNKFAELRARYDLASELMDLPNMEHAEDDLSGCDSLGFFYQDPYEEEGVVVQVNQTPLQVGSALKSKTPDEYAAILGNMPKSQVSELAMNPSRSDRVIQFVITKIIAGISVYMSANNLTQFADGLPNNGHLAISNLKSDIRYSFSHLPVLHSSSSTNESNTLTTRSFHFRQLRAPVYYQNEHKHKEPGSRWVFVKEAQVGKYKAKHIG